MPPAPRAAPVQPPHITTTATAAAAATVTAAATRRRRFGEHTDGNCVAITVDGRDTFEQVYYHMLRAEQSILVANYDLDPHLRFARDYVSPERRRQHSHPHHHHHHSITRSPCRRPLARDTISDESRRYTLQELLVEKARRGVEVKVMVWQPRLALRILPGADERGIDGRADEVEVINAVAKSLGIQDRLEVRVDSTAPTLTSAHHEKLIVVDGRVGFCGGLDLSRGKWDVSTHDYESPLRDAGAEPWHDVNAMVRGPVVWDMLLHFRQRWLFAEHRDRRRARAAAPPPPVQEEPGSVPAVALRTWKEMDRSGGIRAWYAEMFRRAERGIYIENQFPFQSKTMTDLLVRRLKEKPELRVVIVGPMEPNLPGFVGSMIAKMSVNDVNRNLARLRKAGGPGRVGTYALVSQHKTVPTMRRQIYVHSKVMIVDDSLLTVGSANLDKNGLRDSSEFNLGMTSEQLALDLRVRLWHEHTGIPKSRLLDFAEGFEGWARLARANGARVARNRPLVGSVYLYDFEEEGLPAPYDGAPGGSKFAFL
ncbi:phospholipase D-like domain-containing protein [Nitrososphaera sp.]|uniref:phospholipase D-like domain-containing protein n=1 Tax=Nitrososphaera sp. TaxID=1971748 RepID=UPI00307E4ECF